jgi:hypothetical protein
MNSEQSDAMGRAAALAKRNEKYLKKLPVKRF